MNAADHAAFERWFRVAAWGVGGQALAGLRELYAGRYASAVESARAAGLTGSEARRHALQSLTEEPAAQPDNPLGTWDSFALEAMFPPSEGRFPPVPGLWLPLMILLGIVGTTLFVAGFIWSASESQLGRFLPVAVAVTAGVLLTVWLLVGPVREPAVRTWRKLRHATTPDDFEARLTWARRRVVTELVLAGLSAAAGYWFLVLVFLLDFGSLPVLFLPGKYRADPARFDMYRRRYAKTVAKRREMAAGKGTENRQDSHD